eukprot:8957817-Pyramimonas_sp.AAC.1
MLASRKLSSKQKGLFRAQATDAFWTAGDAAAAGYEVSDSRGLRGMERDTLFHGLYICPRLQAERGELPPPVDPRGREGPG